MLGYLSADIICSDKRTVFRECNSTKTMSFEEQIMSKDKYSSIFSRQIEAVIYLSKMESDFNFNNLVVNGSSLCKTALKNIS